MDHWLAFIQTQRNAATLIREESGRPRVARFSPLRTEYDALERGPALVDRTHRGLLEITGADRAAWLHNLTTNHVRDLGVGDGNYAFVLNIKGRILFDLNILVLRDSLWLDLDRAFLATAENHLNKYIITEDVAVADRSDDFVRLGLSGREAPRLLNDLLASNASNLPQLNIARGSLLDTPVTLIRHDFCGPLGFELFVPPDRAVDLWQRLTDPSNPGPALPVGDDAIEVRRIEAGLPRSGRELTDEYLPAETGQLARAVSFNKGCYLGQEVVERMRSRGAVARRLVGVLLDQRSPDEASTADRDNAPALPVAGAAVSGGEGQPFGTLTSCCFSIAANAPLGMAYVKTAAARPDAPVRVSLPAGISDGRLVELPLCSPRA